MSSTADVVKQDLINELEESTTRVCTNFEREPMKVKSSILPTLNYMLTFNLTLLLLLRSMSSLYVTKKTACLPTKC